MNLFILKKIFIKEKNSKEIFCGYGEEYLEMPSGKTYVYSSEDNCYSLSLEEVKDCALNSMVGRDDGPEFLAIVEVPLDTHYVFSCVKNLYLFEYSILKKDYVEVDLSKNDKTIAIVARHYCNYLIKTK